MTVVVLLLIFTNYLFFS